MTTFKVTERQNAHYGHEYPEYTKFARQVGIVTWVPLLIAPNKIMSFALSNLEEIEPVYIPFDPVAIEKAAIQLKADIHETAMAFIFEATKAQTKRMSARKMYLLDLHARISQAIKESPPIQGCALPPRVTATALAIWRPIMELPINQLGSPSHKKNVPSTPGVNLAQSNVLIVLRPPERLSA